MTELLTASQMRAIEEVAIASGAVTGLDLMEHAGAAVVDAILASFPDVARARGRAVVLCGPGNNGGDGFVIARLLRGQGWDPAVFLLGEAERLPPDARVNHDRWAEMGPVAPLIPEAVNLQGAALVIDAVFGTGLTRPVEGATAEVLERACDVKHGHGGPVHVAVDLPSGLSSETGKPLGTAFRADLTVTFHRAKCGHYLADGPEYCGRLVTASIGLPPVSFAARPPGVPSGDGRNLSVQDHGAGLPARLIGPPAVSKRGAHKYDHGHALVLSGPPGQGGAARLAARGALRVGAGLVTLGCPMRAVTENAVQLNAIMVRGLDGTHGLAEVLEDGRINALCLGPGLGLGPSTGELVRSALSAKRGTVLDADALTRFQRGPEALFDMLHASCVLTPHAGEFARLFPDLTEKLRAADAPYSKVDATREAAARAGCVVLFKGPDTVIAAPDGRCSVNAAAYERTVPWLATAGAGDVLAGIICGLMARGLDALQAAEAGAWLHVEAARAFGPGLIAEDLPETLPRVFREMGL